MEAKAFSNHTQSDKRLPGEKPGIIQQRPRIKCTPTVQKARELVALKAAGYKVKPLSCYSHVREIIAMLNLTDE
ncbi:hypothetical protein FACS1894184_12550 [Clostridia bacterium]|nr:hypothetical protein FACS1894184_12550 [Clostridia bacterium]